MDGHSLAALVLLAVLYLAYRRYASPRQAYPPGPKGLPFIGSAFDIDPGRPWLSFAPWSKQYGPVMMFWTFGRPILVLNTLETANALLVKKSAIYSDRPRQIMADEIITDKLNPTLARTRYGTVRNHRKIMTDQLKPAEVKASAHSVQEMECHLMLQDIINKPEGFIHHIERFAASLMLNTSYSIHATTGEDPLVRQIVISMQRFFGAFIAGAYLVDTLPILRFVPSWCPGAQWKRDGYAWQKEDRDMYLGLFEDVERRIAKDGAVHPCLVSRMIEKEHYGKTKVESAYMAGALLAAGTDTTSASFTILLIASLYYPEVYKTLQTHVDKVVGRDRLPSFKDQEDLPYVMAMVREGFRWRTAAPVGIPHALEQDDVITVGDKQYFVPAGTTVVACLHNIHHDERAYVDHDIFDPERFLKPDGSLDNEVQHAGFGFGRRQALAEASLFITLASFAWAFDLEPAVDAQGQKVMPDLDPAHWSSSAASVPPHFPCKITPRSADVVKIMAEAHAAGR